MSIDYKAHNEDRMRRAKSWLKRAEKKAQTDEEAFLFYWIAFNAAYGQLPNWSTSERRKFTKFASRVVEKDESNLIKDQITKNAGSVKALIENQYIYEPFWEFIRGTAKGYWELDFSEDNESVWRNWEKGSVPKMLDEILSRLYTLRNQLIHGGTTYGDKGWGKDQLKSGRNIMAFLVPLIVKIMETSINANPDTDIWGAVAYPRYTEHG